MKTITIMLCLLFLLGGNAYGDQATLLGAEGSQMRQGGGGPASQSGPRFGPPPEAFAACKGKTEGATAQFTGRNGEIVAGICRVADGRLVLRPDRPPGKTRNGHPGPPPEAYRACGGKRAGTSAEFINPRGETLKGTCEEENGRLVFRPDSNRGVGKR